MYDLKIKSAIYKYMETHPQKWAEQNRKNVAKFYESHKEERKLYLREYYQKQKQKKLKNI